MSSAEPTTAVFDPDLARGARPSKGNLAVPYGVAAIAGGLVAMLARELWLVAVLIMFAYLFTGLKRAREQGYTLEFADSFYYLGFTLTLAALLGSLRPFDWGPGAAPTPNDVLKHFGLGLITTLIGVVGRTVLQMYYRTPDEAVERTNQQIAAAAAQYIETIESLNVQATEVLETSLKDLRSKMGDRVTELDTAMCELADRFRNLGTTLGTIDAGEVRERYGRLAASLTAARKPIASQLRQLRRDREALSKELVAAATDAGQLTRALAGAGGAVSAGAEDVRQAVDDVVDRLRRGYPVEDEAIVEQVRLAADRIETESRRIESSLRGSATAIDDIASNLGTLNDTLAAAATQDVVRGIDSAMAEIRRAVVTLSSQTDALATQELPRVGDVMVKFTRQAEDILRVLDEIVAAAEFRLRKIQ